MSEILNIIKKSKGTLLGIGLDDPIYLEAIEENDNIHTCYLLNTKSITGKKFNMTKRGKNKKINVKKLKKYFKKKSIDVIICNFNTIKLFYRSFISNSVYLNNDKLYLYGDKTNLENLKIKYQRYTNNIKLTKKDDTYILIINNENTKTNLLKDFIYKIKDFSSDTLEFITDLLIN